VQSRQLWIARCKARSAPSQPLSSVTPCRFTSSQGQSSWDSWLACLDNSQNPLHDTVPSHRCSDHVKTVFRDNVTGAFVDVNGTNICCTRDDDTGAKERPVAIIDDGERSHTVGAALGTAWHRRIQERHERPVCSAIHGDAIWVASRERRVGEQRPAVRLKQIEAALRRDEDAMGGSIEGDRSRAAPGLAA
jgi:hypothetical protein